MKQVHPTSTHRKGLWAALAIAALTGAGAVTFTPPTTLANADPEPPPSTTTTAAPPPASPNAAPDTAPGPSDPNATPDPNAAPTVDPNAPEAGRINNAAGGFSFVIPASWVESDASHLDYGSALLSKETGQPAAPGQTPPVANDTRIVMGRLDQKLYASAEPDNTKAAARLASDMGEFFMPYPGTRINQETTALSATGMSGGASYYEVKFTDTSKPNGQIWTGVIGSTPTQSSAGTSAQRWFVVWLGTANDPVDKAAAKTLAESIRPFTPAPATSAAPQAPGAVAPAPSSSTPAPAPAPNSPEPAPAPAPAPAGEVAPGTAPAPQATVST